MGEEAFQGQEKGETSVLENRKEKDSKALGSRIGLANREQSGNRKVVQR